MKLDHLVLASLVLVSSSSACGSDDGAADAATDSSVMDSGVADASSPNADASPPDAGGVADAGMVVDGGTDAGTSDCAEETDFTACSVVTSPDRDYDICVAGVCVSPGCGNPSCTPPGPNFTLADTGLRICSSNTATIACPGTSCTSFCGQDAEYGWDVSNPMSARFTRSEPVAGEPVVVDTVTGLAWQGCSHGLSGTDCDLGTSEALLWPDAVAHCDALSWGGFDDWRLPDVLEGHSIMDYGQTAAVTTAAFPNAPMQRHFTTTSWAGGEDAVWIAPFSGVDGKLGVITPITEPTTTAAVRCMRTETPFSYPALPRERDTTVAGEPVVVDHVTGLFFQGCARGQTGDDCAGGANDPATWEDALAYCAALSWASADDWRLPDVKELRSSIDSSRTAPGLDPALYPNAPTLPAWTSTSHVADPTEAWSITVGFGGGIQEGGKVSTLTVRCVR